MLETPSIRWYSFGVTPSSEDVAMSSDNPSGADNQQETVEIRRDPQRLHARQPEATPLGWKVQSDPHGDMGSQAEMT